MFVFDDDVDDDVDVDDDDVQRTTNTILTTTKFVFSCFRLFVVVEKEGQRRTKNSRFKRKLSQIHTHTLVFLSYI